MLVAFVEAIESEDFEASAEDDAAAASFDTFQAVETPNAGGGIVVRNKRHFGLLGGLLGARHGGYG